MRIAVIGCGSIGKRHIQNLKALGVKDLVACDVRADRRNEVAERFGLAQTYEDYQGALSDGANAAFVCTPPVFHMPAAMAAARAGCHLFIEKPLSSTLEGVDELLSLCEERRLLVMTGYNMRFWAPIVQIKALIQAGRIGRVLTGRVGMSGYLPDFHPSEGPREYFMFQKALGGGALLDMSHGIDFMCWFLGRIEAVSAFHERVGGLEMDADDTTLLLARFTSGALVDFHFDLLGRAPRKSCEVIGEQGTITWDTVSHEVRAYDAQTARWTATSCEVAYNEVYLAELRHFLECLAQGKTPMVTGADGKHALEVIEAARRSAQEGRVIQLASTAAAAVR